MALLARQTSNRKHALPGKKLDEGQRVVEAEIAARMPRPEPTKFGCLLAQAQEVDPPCLSGCFSSSNLANNAGDVSRLQPARCPPPAPRRRRSRPDRNTGCLDSVQSSLRSHPPPANAPDSAARARLAGRPPGFGGIGGLNLRLKAVMDQRDSRPSLHRKPSAITQQRQVEHRRSPSCD